MLGKQAHDNASATKEELLDIVISPEKTETLLAKFKDSGHHFGLIAQSYSGDQAAIIIDPGQKSGYELLMTEDHVLKSFFKDQELDRCGRVK